MVFQTMIMLYYTEIVNYYMTSAIEWDRKNVMKRLQKNSKKAIISKSNVTGRNNTLKGGTQNAPKVKDYWCTEIFWNQLHLF